MGQKSNTKLWIAAGMVALHVAMLLPFIVKQLHIKGYHKPLVTNIHPGVCARVPGIEEGAADMELLPGGKVLISSGRLWPLDNPDIVKIKGKIILVDLNQKKVKPVPVKIKGKTLDKSNFFPIGLSKWINKKTGRITIFVVNNQATIERFIYSDKDNSLTHVETITPERHALHIEDVAAVSEKKFYYANRYGANPRWEYNLLLAWANIAFYDGQNTTLVDDQLIFPSGVATSQDGKYLYVNTFGDQTMKTYQINKDFSLEWYERKTHDLGFLGDNIFVDPETGNIWSTGHPIGKDAFHHLEVNPYHISPTKVVRMRVQDGVVTSTSHVFTDDGNLLSGGTISVFYNKRLLVGSSMKHAVLCDGVKL